MINSYGEHKNGLESLKLFNKMIFLGIKSNEITITSILNACSHSNLVDEAISIFNDLEIKYNIIPNEKTYNMYD